MNQETKTCRDCGGSFLIDPDDTSFYQKIGVPPPDECPDCRQQRRMLFRNFKTLYKRTSDKSGKPLVSMYGPDKPYKIYSHEEWWSDDLDPLSFGREFDPNRPFFDQFNELLLDVPRFALMNTRSERCEYSNMTFGSKNCYLVFGCVDDEDCAYGHIVWESKDSLDNLYVYKSERLYECIDCLGSYKLAYSQECEDCTDCTGLYDCRGCTNCIGCVGLRQKSYHIFNEAVSREKYAAFLSEHPLWKPGTIPMILAKRDALRRDFPHKYLYGSKNDRVSGNHIYNAKNVRYSFDVKGGEDSRFIFTGRNAVDSYDISFSVDFEQSCQVVTAKGNRISFSHLAINCADAWYSDCCFNSRNIFGCAGLKGNEYVILNKQYPKTDYEALREKIVSHMKQTGEWGQFFPKNLSPFGYNESIAQEYAPLTKEQAVSLGFAWQDNIPFTTGQETIEPEHIPENPEVWNEKLADEVLRCTTCSKNYRFIPIEITFCKSMNLPLPRECFNCRHARRMRARTERKLHKAACAQCGNELLTSFRTQGQDAFRVYCEQCYTAEVA